jgi:tetratricopeptide (TPR) repeat protein
MTDLDLESEIRKGEEFFKQTHFDKALNHFKVLLKFKNHYLIHWYLSHIYFKFKKFQEALNHINQTITLKSQDQINLNFKGEILLALRENAQSKRVFEDVLKIEKNNEVALYNLVNLNMIAGKFDKSINLLKQLININPDDLRYRLELIRLDQSFLTKKLVKNLNYKLSNSLLKSKKKIYAQLILAKYYELNKDFEQEIKFLIKAHQHFYDENLLASKQEKNFYTNLVPQFMTQVTKVDYSNYDDQINPIFIMGLPRSGTTLVENLIYKSGQVEVGDETEIITQTLCSKDIISDLDSKILKTKFSFNSSELESLKKKIIKKYNTNKLGINEKKFTDKSLENFLYLPLLMKIFPNAKFIYCKRNIKENVLGILKVFLPQILWSHSLNAIFNFVKFYSMYESEYLKNKNLLTVKLEELTHEPNKTSKKIYEYLNLNWSDDITNKKQSSYVNIRTASNIQVRNAIIAKNDSNIGEYERLLKVYGYDLNDLIFN